MGALRILHLADLHLGWAPAFLGERAAEWQRQRDQVLKTAVDFALKPENAIDLVLIAGDLFDTHVPEAGVAEEAMRQLRRLTAAGIKVVTVPGNHDEITYLDSVYRRRAEEWPGVLVQNPNAEKVVSFSIKGEACHVYSLAYTGGVTRTEPGEQNFSHSGEAGWHIAAFHGSLDWDAGDRSLPLAGDALARAGYNYVALGHIHRGGEKRLGQTLAVYPGLVAGKGWHDPGCGEVAVAVLDKGGGLPRVERHPLECPPCCVFQRLEVDAGRYSAAEELSRAVAEQVLPGGMVSVVLKGVPEFALDAEKLRGDLSESAYYVEVVDETESYPAHLLAAWAKENTLRGYFLRRMQERLAEAGEDEQKRRTAERAIVKGLKALGMK